MGVDQNPGVRQEFTVFRAVYISAVGVLSKIRKMLTLTEQYQFFYS
jgi:hypothetical protein